MKKLLILIVLFLSLDNPAQEREFKDFVHLSGEVFDFANNEELEFFEVRVIIDTDIILSERYYDRKNYNLKLPYGFEYTVIFFSKNYVSRKVFIDLMDIPFANKKVYPLQLDLGLMAKRKGLRTRDISKSFSGIARYSPTRDRVEWFPNQKERVDKIISGLLSARKP
ncbi:MAG: hypothetical protein AAF487_04015 [Bacteroidota bacterium]